MLAETTQQGFPKPIIEEIANRLRIIIPLSQLHSVAEQPESRPESELQEKYWSALQTANSHVVK